MSRRDAGTNNLKSGANTHIYYYVVNIEVWSDDRKGLSFHYRRNTRAFRAWNYWPTEQSVNYNDLKYDYMIRTRNLTREQITCYFDCPRMNFSNCNARVTDRNGWFLNTNANITSFSINALRDSRTINYAVLISVSFYFFFLYSRCTRKYISQPCRISYSCN